MKRQFLDFYVEKKFFSDSTPGKVDSFVKDKDNIFFSTSKFPRKFLFGLLLTFSYIVGLTILSFYMFKRYLFLPSPVKDLDFKIRSAFKPAKVFSMVNKKMLDFTWEDDFVIFEVEKLGQFDGIVIVK